MGIFKDLKDMADVARSDELKDMRKMAKAQPRPSMMSALRTGTAAMTQVSAMQGALTDGVAGTATIDAVAATGEVIGHTPVLAFDLTVTVPGRPAYRVHHTQMVPAVQIPGFQPGATVPLRVSPENPEVVFVGAC